MQACPETKQDASPVQQLGTLLHDMCQPLTALQCRLEMADLTNRCEDYRQAVTKGIDECARLSDHVHKMRQILRELMAASETED